MSANPFSPPAAPPVVFPHRKDLSWRLRLVGRVLRVEKSIASNDWYLKVEYNCISEEQLRIFARYYDIGDMGVFHNRCAALGIVEASGVVV